MRLICGGVNIGNICSTRELVKGSPLDVLLIAVLSSALAPQKLFFGSQYASLKGRQQDSAPRRMTVWLHEERTSISPYGASDQRAASVWGAGLLSVRYRSLYNSMGGTILPVLLYERR